MLPEAQVEPLETADYEVLKESERSDSERGGNTAFVVPCYNEADTIYETLEHLEDIAAAEPYAVHLVDDASTDGTMEEINRYLQDNPNTDVVTHAMLENGNKVGALKEVTQHLDGEIDYVVYMDSDTELLTPETVNDATQYMEEHGLAGVAGRVTPKKNGDNLYEQALIQFQDLEYSLFHTLHHLTTNTGEHVDTKSLLRHASGAGAVYDRMHAEMALDVHSGRHNADDMELSALIQLFHGAELGYVPELEFETDVPKSISDLVTQRQRWLKGSLETYDSLLPFYMEEFKDLKEHGSHAAVTALDWKVWPLLAAGSYAAAEGAVNGDLSAVQNTYLAEAAVTGAWTAAGIGTGEITDKAKGVASAAAFPAYAATVWVPAQFAAAGSFLKDKTGEAVKDVQELVRTEKIEEGLDDVYAETRQEAAVSGIE